MTLLRWIHLRQLVPLSDLIDGLEKGAPARPSAPVRPAAPPRPSPPAPVPRAPGSGPRSSAPSVAAKPAESVRPEPTARPSAGKPVETTAALPSVEPVPTDRLKEAFLDEVRRAKKFFYGTVIAQAQRIDVESDRIVFTFGPQHRPLKSQLEQQRPLLETIAAQLSGRKMSIVAAEGTPPAPNRPGPGAGSQAAPDEKKAALREQALADSGVQAMLDVFAAEIKDVEEM
jgi:hypothetical protein